MRSLSLSALSRTAAIAIVIAGAAACAPSSSSTPTPTALGPQPVASASQVASTPVLLSCPVGQQPLMRQVVVQGALVPQVECVAAALMVPTGVAPAAPAMLAGAPPAYATPAYATSAPVQTYGAPSPGPVRTVAIERPQARRVSSGDGVVEYRRPAKRSWQKSAVIIGSAAGAGAGVGALAKGKKGALIGAAIGGGAATVWDQVTRRQPR
jgi:hypothetical protein